MKNRKTKTTLRLTALLLLSALLLVLLAGCKNNGTAGASDADPVSATAAQTTPGTSAAGSDPSDSTPIPGDLDGVTSVAAYTLTELSADDPRLDTVVASAGSRELTNRELQIFYYMQFFGFMSQYGDYASYFGLDLDKPLAEQQSVDENLTWEQYFLAAALDQFHQFSAVYDKAVAEGHTLSEDEQTRLDEVLAGLPDEAARYGYDSVDDYIAASFGPGVSEENYASFMRIYFLAVSYEDKMFEAISWTDDDLLEYVKAHPEDFSDVENAVNNVMVRHILIQPETAGASEDSTGISEEEAKAAAKARAEELLEEYLSDPTEEHFAELAKEHSTDGGSASNGGLYDDVYPGQMVETFNDWCFDETRKPGDTGIVETNYGYHIMYFVGQTDHPQWKATAAESYQTEAMTNAIDEIMDASPLTVDYASIIIAPMPEEEAEAAE